MASEMVFCEQPPYSFCQGDHGPTRKPRLNQTRAKRLNNGKIRQREADTTKGGPINEKWIS